MKSYRDCVAEFTATKKNLDMLDKESDRISETMREAVGKIVPLPMRKINNEMVFSASETNEKLRELRDRLNEIAGQKKIMEITMKIWKENARQAVFAETAGVIAEMIGKYAGKPFGEKTAAKFKEEFKERTGFGIYFNREQYREEICLVDVGYFFRHGELEISVKDKKLFDGNKLVACDTEDLRLNYCADYVENPANRASEIVNRFAELKAAYEVFENQCKAFNELLPTSINNVYTGNFKGYLY